MNSKLLNLAKDAALNAYAPYSNFRVGAVVELENGAVFSGCNIENSSYGLTMCAERVAIFKALSEKQNSSIKSIAIAGLDAQFITPCGACREVIAECARKQNSDIEVIMTNGSEMIVKKISELLPIAFNLK